MSSKNLEDLLSQLHTLTAEAHIARILSGEMSDKDLEAARKFLADNKYTADARNSNPIRQLTKVLPYGDPELSTPKEA